MRTLKVGKNDAGKRVDKFLLQALCGLPQTLLYKYFRKKCVKVNGKHVQPEFVLSEGDELGLYISDEFFGEKKSQNKPFMLESATLQPDEIVYEDDNIMIIDKPQGELVHSSLADEVGKTGEVCLVDRFIGYLHKKGEYDPENEQSFTPSLCNRIDRNTCGLVIAAKNARALRVMNQKIRDRELTKLYRTVVEGTPEKPSATLHDFLYKDRAQNRVYIFSSRESAKRVLRTNYDDDIKTVITKYRVLESNRYESLLEVELVTGRTHQIRAHLSYIGHPIVGDGKYAKNHAAETGVKFQKLCSYSLRFEFSSPSDGLDYLDGKEFYSHYDFKL